MPNIERVTVTLPDNLIKDIDRHEKNRSRFVAEAVRRELDRRRRLELRRSLGNPHPETARFVDSGFEEWAQSLPKEDADGLLDSRALKPIRWIPGKGWASKRK
jgi:hypothetical protein